MCDENNQLPNSVPLFGGNTAGGSWQFSGSGALHQCPTCHFWYTGYHNCGGVTLTADAGYAVYPQSVPVKVQTGLTPHVCPVCEGSGEKDTGKCPACKGACVLWG
jgi:DnaJ-class molecular chaperone